MHTLTQYVWMVGDAVRVAAYSDAIRAVVRPGDSVVDLGAGFGYFSVVAAQAGAGRVDAIEINPVVHLGPRIAAANGCADRIVFHACAASDAEVPARADVIIADLRRQTPFSRHAIATIVEARERLLRPGGHIVAARDRLMAAPSRAPRAFRHDVQALDRHDAVNLRDVERIIRDTPHPYHVEPEALLAAGGEWGSIDYATVTSPGYAGDATFTFDGTAEADGVTVWFESELAPGIFLSSAPGAPGHTYGQLFLPFPAPLRVPAGARVRVRVGAQPAGDDYVWTWETWIDEASGERLVSAQNSMAETVLDPTALAAANRQGG